MTATTPTPPRAPTTRFGYFLSSEEWNPRDLVRLGVRAERAGFDALWISDHFHPWNSAQGHASFVWSVVGALAQASTLPVTTAVTCPTIRMHPAVTAQAAATAQSLLRGRFRLGVGSGEALNEHVLGDRWPTGGQRLAMLDEAVEVMRRLWTGRRVDHHGRYYTVEDARLYGLDDEPPPVYMSAFGRRAVAMAARVADGYICTQPRSDLVTAFREQGGAGKIAQGGLKVCWAPDEVAGVQTALRLWASELLPGELPQVLSSPRHFEQAASLVTEKMMADAVVCGSDVDRHVAALCAYVDAGFDEVYVQQVGPDQEQFFNAYEQLVLPRVREHVTGC